MTAKRILKHAASLAAALAVTGCGFAPGYQPLPVTPFTSDYTGGQRLIRQEPIPVLPPGVEARGLQLEPGQVTARVGESLPFRVVVKGSDNKVYNDPRLVIWSLSNTQLGQVDRQGILIPAAPGTVKVVAQIGQLAAEATVQVEPARYAWQQVLSPTGATLRAVKMVTRFEAWAGGDGGTLLHFANGAWRQEPSFRQGDAAVRGLGFASTSQGWAVGSRNGGTVPFIARWDGMAWHTVSLPVTSGVLNAISVVNERDAWAVGESDGDALMLRWDGVSWKQAVSPGSGKLNDVHMVSARSGWAVGKGGGAARAPLMLRFENGSWAKKNIWDNRGTVSLTDTQELTAVKMLSETQGYAVGVRDNILFRPRGIFLQFDPKRDGWVWGSYDASVDGIEQVPLYDIEMISGTEGWALGQVRRPDWTFERNARSVFGNLLANVNGVLKADTSFFSGNINGAFFAIDLLPQGEGFVVGENGIIMQRTFDWRGINNGAAAGGAGSQAALPVTYGPGGTTVPGGTPVAQF